MKNTLVKLFTILALATNLQAAVTYTIANFTGSASSATNGLPVVDAAGAAILNSTNSTFASIGYLTAGGDNTAASVLSRFVPADLVPLAPSVSGTIRNGLFNGADYNSASNTAIPGFTGKTAVLLIGNNATIANSTAIAAFVFATTFSAPDPVNGAAQTFQLTDTSSPLVGTLRSVTTQPSGSQTTNFDNGVVLVPIPETSTSLLGAIGALALLRRRRN